MPKKTANAGTKISDSFKIAWYCISYPFIATWNFISEKIENYRKKKPQTSAVPDFMQEIMAQGTSIQNNNFSQNNTNYEQIDENSLILSPRKSFDDNDNLKISSNIRPKTTPGYDGDLNNNYNASKNFAPKKGKKSDFYSSNYDFDDKLQLNNYDQHWQNTSLSKNLNDNSATQNIKSTIEEEERKFEDDNIHSLQLNSSPLTHETSITPPPNSHLQPTGVNSIVEEERESQVSQNNNDKQNINKQHNLYVAL